MKTDSDLLLEIYKFILTNLIEVDQLTICVIDNFNFAGALSPKNSTSANEYFGIQGVFRKQRKDSGDKLLLATIITDGRGEILLQHFSHE